jgi:hypothetical protein
MPAHGEQEQPKEKAMSSKDTWRHFEDGTLFSDETMAQRLEDIGLYPLLNLARDVVASTPVGGVIKTGFSAYERIDEDSANA